MKKNDKILIGIIGIAGLGLLAYYLMKKSAEQPSPQPQPQPQPITPEPITIPPIISSSISSKCVEKCR